MDPGDHAVRVGRTSLKDWSRKLHVFRRVGELGRTLSLHVVPETTDISLLRSGEGRVRILQTYSLLRSGDGEGSHSTRHIAPPDQERLERLDLLQNRPSLD